MRGLTFSLILLFYASPFAQSENAYVKFFPDYRLSADGTWFFNHKNAAYRERFLLETNSNLDFFLVGVGRTLIGLGLDVKTGMGRQSGAILFDPRDVKYGLVPEAEIQFDQFDLLTGLDHFCVHAIDRRVEKGAFWNKFFVDLRSKNYRPFEYRKAAGAFWRGDWRKSMAYSLRTGIFVNRAFGWVESDVLYAGRNSKVEITLQSRGGLYQGRGWLINALLTPNWDFTGGGEVRQTYFLGMEAHPLTGKGGFCFFLNHYLLDQAELWNKDKISEFGIRGYL